MDGDSGPVVGEDGAGKWLDLAEADGSHPDGLEPKGEATDPREQVKDIHHAPRSAAKQKRAGGRRVTG